MTHKINPTELAEKFEQLIAQNATDAIREELQKHHSHVTADILQQLKIGEVVVVFRLLPEERAAKTFRWFDADTKASLLRHLSHQETATLLSHLKPDERVSLIESMPEKVSHRLLNMLEPEDKAETAQLLSYPIESIGRLMTPDFIAVKADWSVAQALEHIRSRAHDSETINVVYVTGDTANLEGYVSLSRLILAKETAKIRSIMDTRISALSTHDDREHAVTLMHQDDLAVMPVVNDDQVLIGIVTSDDVAEVDEQETTEDFHKTSAITPLSASYSKTPILRLVERRIGWLIGLVVINLASSSVIASYEETLTSAVALAFFIPLLIDSGGNAGAQSATLMIRAISVGDVQMRNWLKVISKELLVGMTLAIALGLAAAIMGIVQGGPVIGVIVGLSMGAIIIITNLLGSMLPFLLTRIKVDPAVASGPLVTSVADVVGLSIYFTIATMLLGHVA